MDINETTNHDYILTSKACQCHLKTRAANVWDLVQSDQAPFTWNLVCLCWFFSRWTLVLYKPGKRRSVHLTLSIEATLSLFAK